MMRTPGHDEGLSPGNPFAAGPLVNGAGLARSRGVHPRPGDEGAKAVT
jgi:hypothetical protein